VLQMRDGGHADVLPVLQVPANTADAVPCEGLPSESGGGTDHRRSRHAIYIHRIQGTGARAFFAKNLVMT